MLQEQTINLNMQQYIILRNFTYDIEKEYLESDIFAMSSHLCRNAINHIILLLILESNLHNDSISYIFLKS